MRPISDREPVATTTPRAMPLVTSVPLNAMQWRSPSATSSPTGWTRFWTGLEQHDVADNERFAINAAARAVAHYRRTRRQHLAYRVHRLFRLAFLDKADNRIRENDRQNHQRIDRMVEQRRYGGGAEQHVNQDVVEMGQKPEKRIARGW